MIPSAKAIFIDTNDYLHYTFFTDIDWPAVVEAKEVKIVVPPVITRELDKHKYAHPQESVRKRAHKVTSRFAQFLKSQTEVRPNTTIYFEAQESHNEIVRLNLSRESQDDELLASISLYRAQHPEEEIALITNDVTLHIKALPLKIDTFELSEDHRLPVETDEKGKRIRELEQKIRDFQNRMPEPILVFENGENKQVFNVPLKLETQTVAERVDELRIKFPKLPEPPPEPSPARQARHGSVDLNQIIIEGSRYPDDQPHPADIRKYNRDLESFYGKYENYLNENDKAILLTARTIQPKIQLQNSGTAPAERVTVFMRIPADVALRTNENDFQRPDEPNAPEPPKPRRSTLDSLDILRRPHFFPEYLRPLTFQQPLEPPNIERNAIETRDGFHYVSFLVRQATHNLIYPCPYDLFVLFDSLENAHSFQIGWEIISANLPNPTKGTLNVIVERDAT